MGNLKGVLEKLRQQRSELGTYGRGFADDSMPYRILKAVEAAFIEYDINLAPEPKRSILPMAPTYSVGDMIVHSTLGLGQIDKYRDCEYWDLRFPGDTIHDVSERFFCHATQQEIARKEPKFKVGDWVVGLKSDPALYGKIFCVMRIDPAGEIHLEDSEVVTATLALYLRHATKDEKFRAGAVIQYEADGVIIQDEIIDYVNGGVIFKHNRETVWHTDYCTLKKAATSQSQPQA